MRGALILLALVPAPLWAQAADLDIPVAAADHFPRGISVRARVYTDQRGLTLYGMDMRAATGRTGQPALYCSGECLTQWEPLLAPRGAPVSPVPREFGGPRAPSAAVKPASDNPDWTVIEGPAGPQWVYKKVHLIFTRKGDTPGSTAHDGTDDFLWNSLKYLPPPPRLIAPPDVAARLVDGAYVLADAQGNRLFSPKNKACADPCGWRPHATGMVRQGVGQWTVRQTADQAQWVYRGKPVYRADPRQPVPAEGVALTP
jgi:predicted lipoprotein with Yx(FWY)xxD motif